MTLLRDGTEVQDPRLDRMYEGDIRNRQYSVGQRLKRGMSRRRTKSWACNTFLDQGSEGSCVGHGFAHELAAEPTPVPNMTHLFAKQTLYWEIQKIDPWVGGSYPGANPVYEGTSVLSGAKYLTKLGYYTGYHWAHTEPELALAVGYLGPVVVGLNWTEGMYEPNASGFIRPIGKSLGGHCLLVTGYNATHRYYTLHNSWGPSWGTNGTAKLSVTSMALLLSQQGEACVPEGRQLVSV